MARKLGFILFLALTVSACTRQSADTTDLERYQLAGNVLCVSVDMGEGRSYTAWFDRRGMLDSLVQENPSEVLSNVYTYDSRGRLAELAIYRPDRHYEGYYLYEYEGDIMSRQTLFGWDLQAIFDWRFDIEDGRQTRCRHYNEGALVSTTEYVYGPSSKMEKVYDSNGEPCGEITYRFAEGFRIKSIESEDVHIDIEYDRDLLPARSTGGEVEPDSEITTSSKSRTYGTIEYRYIKDDLGNWTVREESYPSCGISGRTITRTITYR